MRNTLLKRMQLALVAMACSCYTLNATVTDYTKGLSIWFDTPNTLQNRAIWYDGRPDLWQGKKKPISAGDTAIAKVKLLCSEVCRFATQSIK